MSILELVMYPNPILSQVAEPVEEFSEDFPKLIADMAETMYEGKGVGLAAPQIGLSKRLFIVDVSAPDEPHNLKVFINPTIVQQDTPVIWNEGCLSLPGLYRDVKTFNHVIVDAFDIKGNPFRHEASDIEAVAILHENAHLDGKVFIDRLAPVKRSLVKKFWKKNAERLCKETYKDSRIHVRWE